MAQTVAPLGPHFRRAMQSDAQPAAEPSDKPKKRVEMDGGMIRGQGQEQIRSQLSNPQAHCFFTDTGMAWW